MLIGRSNKVQSPRGIAPYRDNISGKTGRAGACLEGGYNLLLFVRGAISKGRINEYNDQVNALDVDMSSLKSFHARDYTPKTLRCLSRENGFGFVRGPIVFL